MAAPASCAPKLPAVNESASFEIAYVTSAQVALESDELYGSGSPRIIGKSAALRRVLGIARIVAPTGSTVLIDGETGTGKELIAEAIHKWSDRSNGPFVRVNCAAIPADLLESELFGHERGAYTGAVARVIGRFERAHRGTLLLDEIGDLPLELQPKLLRVMQERQFERLGGAATIQTDVRVICATHRNLVEMVESREFRADLFYRLSVFPIELPPLRERREDIRLLVHHFAMDYAARMNKRITAISEEFMTALVGHSWPGNVRELQNFIERSVILSSGDVLLPELTHNTGRPEVVEVIRANYSGTGGEVAHPSDSPTNANLKKELTNMLTSIPGARLSWHFANGWVFEPAIVGPDVVEYTLKEGPHAGRHAIQHFYYERVAPGGETQSGTRSGALVHITSYLETQTVHRFAALPA
jgi:transcriptional regulator with GAF, ATPase, and Fis domain